MRHLWTFPQGPHCFVSEELLAVGTSTGRIRLWDLATGRLDSSLGGKCLAFLLRSRPDDANLNSSPIELGGPVEVNILRNGVLLRQTSVKLEQGTVRLSAERKNEVLSVRINDRDLLSFRDVLPALRPHEGLYGLVWPSRARIGRLATYRQPLPDASSPLEVADELYGAGRYYQALEELRRQAQTTGELEVNREAECKSALCMLAVGRREDAIATFEQLCQIGRERDRWTVVSLFQLWLLKVQELSFGDASGFAERLMRYDDPASLSEFVSSDTRRQILEAYAPLLNSNYGAALYNSARHLLAIHEAMELLPVSATEEEAIGLRLVASLRGTHQELHAEEIARELLARMSSNGRQDTLGKLPRLDKLQARSYLAHVIGDEARCLQEVDELLFGSNDEQVEWRLEQVGQELTQHLAEPRGLRPGLMPDGCTLLLERGRILARTGRWTEARECLKEFHRFANLTFLPYQQYAVAHLLDGWTHRAAGEPKQAATSWRRARWRSWQVEYLQASQQAPSDAAHWMLDLLAASLAGEASPKLARATWEAMCHEALLNELPKIVDLHGDFGQDQFEAAWSAPTANLLARQIACGELGSAERLRGGIELVLSAVVAKGCRSEAPAHDRLVRETVTGMLALVRTGRVTPGQLRDILAVWRGNLDGTSWEGSEVMAAFPEQRAQVAYLLGIRMLQTHARPDDAQRLFQIASDSSAPSTVVHELASQWAESQ